MAFTVLDHLQTLTPLGEAERQAVQDVCRIRQCDAKTLVQRAGEPCTQLTFVNRGLLRVYFVTEDHERTCRFLPEDCWYTDFESFSSGAPSLEYLETLEPTEITLISKSDLDRLYRQFPNPNR